MIPADRPLSARLVATAVVVFCFLVPAAGLILAGVERTASYFDQRDYHLPTIRQFEREWPTPDLATYPAAMTPGYHLLMTAIAKLGGGVTAMQFATLAITAGFLAMLAWALSRRLTPIDAVLLCLPMAWSQYVLAAGVYVVPHNLAWWGVLALVLLIADRCWSVKSTIAGAVLLALTVLSRQIHLWLAAPMLAWAWWRSSNMEDHGKPVVDEATRSALIGTQHSALSTQHCLSRWARVAIAVVACIPAILLLLYFRHLWGGLAPTTQAFARPAGGINVGAIVMILATFGFLAPAMIGRLPRGRGQWIAVLLATALGGAIALATPTTFDRDAGRWTGLWNYAHLLGIVGGRSVLITALAAIGAGCVGLLLSIADRRCVWLAILAGFIAANAAVNQAWQRYYEPMVLIATALLLRDDTAAIDARGLVVRWALRIAVVLMQAGLTVAAFR